MSGSRRGAGDRRGFDHERLRVYAASLDFVEWAQPILSALPRTAAVRRQLDRAATSIPLNIAEGNGKFTAPDRCRFLDIARGSALESAACLDVIVAKGMAAPEGVAAGKVALEGIVSMLVGLIRSNSEDRVHEDTTPYGTGKLPQLREE